MCQMGKECSTTAELRMTSSTRMVLKLGGGKDPRLREEGAQAICSLPFLAAAPGSRADKHLERRVSN